MEELNGPSSSRRELGCHYESSLSLVVPGRGVHSTSMEPITGSNSYLSNGSYAYYLTSANGPNLNLSSKKSTTSTQRHKKRNTIPQTLYVRPSGPSAETFVFNKRDYDKEKLNSLPLPCEQLISAKKDELEGTFKPIFCAKFLDMTMISAYAMQGLRFVSQRFSNTMFTAIFCFAFFLLVDLLLVIQARSIINSALHIQREVNQELLFFVSGLGENFYQKDKKLQTLVGSSPNASLTCELEKMAAEVGLLRALYNESLGKLSHALDYPGGPGDLEFLLQLHYNYDEELQTMLQQEWYFRDLIKRNLDLQKKRTLHSSSCDNRKEAFGSTHGTGTYNERGILNELSEIDAMEYPMDKLDGIGLENTQEAWRSGDVNDNRGEVGGHLHRKVSAHRNVFSFPSLFKKGAEELEAQKISYKSRMLVDLFSPKRFLHFLLICLILCTGMYLC